MLVDDAREITAEQAQAYQATGKRMKLPGEKRSAAAVGSFKRGAGTRGPGAAAVNVAAPVKIAPRLYVRLNNSNDQSLLLSLKQVLDGNQGNAEVVLVLGPADSKQVIKLPVKCSAEDAMLAKLRDIVGHANVKVQ